MKPLRPDFTDIYLEHCTWATGRNHMAAIFLHALATWMATTTVQFNGRYCVAYTWKDWCDKLLFTEDQLRRVLAKLKNQTLGLIVCETHSLKGSTRLYVRTSDKCPDILEESRAAYIAYRQKPRSDRTGKNADTVPAKTTECILDTQGDEKEDNQKNTPAIAVGVPLSETLEKAFEEESKKEKPDNNVLSFPKPKHVPAENDQGGSDVATLDQIAGNYSNDKYKAKAKAKINNMKPDAAATLIAIWQDEYRTLGLPPAVFSYPEKAAIKAILEAIPAGTGPEFIRTAVRRWSDVVEIAESDFGAYKLPAKATVAAVSKYASAVQMVMAKAANKAVHSIAQSGPKELTPSEIYIAKMMAKKAAS